MTTDKHKALKVASEIIKEHISTSGVNFELWAKDNPHWELIQAALTQNGEQDQMATPEQPNPEQLLWAAVNALRLELPEPVWRDVNAKIIAGVDYIKATALTQDGGNELERLRTFYKQTVKAAGDLEGLPDGHAFDLVWRDDEAGNGPDDGFITAGMIRRVCDGT